MLKRTRLAFGLSGAVACALGAAALGAFGSERAETPAVVAAVAATGATELAFDPDRCVTAFSKDLCEGGLEPGKVLYGSCSTPDQDCRTVCGIGAKWWFSLQHNPDACADACDPFVGRCDEAIGKDGRLSAEINYTMRFQRPCPYRACFEGRFEFYAEDGSIYQGTVTGTMGVGTHRPSQCPFGGRDCERCHDVDLLVDQDPAQYRIGVEASFQGIRINDPTRPRDEICFTLSGDFIAPTLDDICTLNPEVPWRFAGTADGAHIHCN